MSFHPLDQNLLFSRGDKSDPRLGEMVQLPPESQSTKAFLQSLATSASSENTDSPSRPTVIAGYADDEGIRINGGRLGASQGPSEVRRALYKMTPALFSRSSEDPNFWPKIWDVGDMQPDLNRENQPAMDLSGRHQFAAEHVHAALAAGAKWIGIGGGHDYGFADAAGFCTWMQTGRNATTRPLVINFDAHLDVRPVDRGISSGTPFFRMLEKYPNVDFVEVGIQGQCNSRSHFEWAKARGARILTMEELEASGQPLVTMLTNVLDDWLIRPRPLFLSIDIDGFSSAIAPGCSQSWATGFSAHDFFPCLTLLSRRFDLRVLGIYEVSPPLDHDRRTAKLAAQIIHRVLS